jgi:FkbM family methyltransferase
MKGKNAIRKIFKAMRLIVNPLYRRAMFKGVAATIEHAYVLNFLRRQGINHVIDIGANVGQFSLAVRNCLPNAKIFAFEPLARPAKRFSLVLGNDPNVTLFQSAIGSTTGDAIMHISKSLDSSSLLPITDKQSELFPGTEETRQEKVKVAPLDEFLDRQLIKGAALLKIDVQGYELETLKGCEALLDMFTYLYVECSCVELYLGQPLAHHVIAWLAKREFILSRVGSITYDKQGMSIQGDFLFKSVNRSIQ